MQCCSQNINNHRARNSPLAMTKPSRHVWSSNPVFASKNCWQDNSFCSRLGVLLDREESGMICFDRLLHFISNALDTERTPPRFLAFSLEEECFNQLEWQLSKDFGRTGGVPKFQPFEVKFLEITWNGAKSWYCPRRYTEPCRMLYNKHNKSTTESIARRFERAADPEPPRPSSPPPRPTTPRCPAARAGSASPERGTPRGTPRLSRCHLLYHQAVFGRQETWYGVDFGPRFWLFFLVCRVRLIDWQGWICYAVVWTLRALLSVCHSCCQSALEGFVGKLVCQPNSGKEPNWKRKSRNWICNRRCNLVLKLQPFLCSVFSLILVTYWAAFPTMGCSGGSLLLGGSHRVAAKYGS